MKLKRCRAYSDFIGSGFWFGVLEYDRFGREAFRRGVSEAYYLQLPLPSWGLHWSFLHVEDRWCQLHLLWHGWHGFRFEWLPEDSI